MAPHQGGGSLRAPHVVVPRGGSHARIPGAGASFPSPPRWHPCAQGPASRLLVEMIHVDLWSALPKWVKSMLNVDIKSLADLKSGDMDDWETVVRTAIAKYLEHVDHWHEVGTASGTTATGSVSHGGAARGCGPCPRPVAERRRGAHVLRGQNHVLRSMAHRRGQAGPADHLHAQRQGQETGSPSACVPSATAGLACRRRPARRARRHRPSPRPHHHPHRRL